MERGGAHGDQDFRESAWKAALRKAGVRYRTLYQPGHTDASMMLTAGESPIWVASQMGLANTAMIFKNHGQWIKNAAPEVENKAVEMFSGVGK